MNAFNILVFVELKASTADIITQALRSSGLSAKTVSSSASATLQGSTSAHELSIEAEMAQNVALLESAFSDREFASQPLVLLNVHLIIQL